MFNLSKGSLKKILEGNNYTDPLLQILNIKNIQNNNVDSMTRYKITLYDGDTQHTFGILATQKNYLIENDEIKPGTVIKLQEYAANVLSKDPQKVVIILMNFDIMGEMDIKTGTEADSVVPKRANNENQEPVKVPSKPNVKQITPEKPAANNSSINSSKFFKSESLKQPNKANTTTQSSGAKDGMFNGFKIFSISSLNPYQNKWSIKARVTNKSSIRTWSNARGEGRLFSIDLIDQSGEIKASLFNEQCDKFYDTIQPDKVYLISKAQLKTANKQYSTLDNDYEMTFNNETLVEPCEEDYDCSIPRLNLNLIPLSELSSKNANDLVDVIGVVRVTGDIMQIVSKQTNKELKKRDIHIVDNSSCSVSVTLWGKMAEDFDASDKIVVLKGAKVSEYNGKSLGVLSSTTFMIDPDIPEAHSVRGWYDQGGNQGEFQDLSTGGNLGGGASAGSSQTNWKCLDQLKDEQLGMGDKADYFSSTATVLFAKKENSMYMACPTEGCNKKVVDQNDGTFRCEKCGKDFDIFKWRMILSLNIGDNSESQWVTCFQETSELILGIKAQDLGDLKSTNSPKFDECFSNAIFKEFTFKMRAKMETYNDERRVKVTVVNAEEIDYVAASKRLLQKIKAYVSSN